jgi:L-asparaginase II
MSDSKGGGPMFLVDVFRGGRLESRHAGSFVLLDGNGEIEIAVGDVTSEILPRSSLKPLQATTMVEAGFAGRGAELALAAASHDGEDVHRDGARSVLAAAGLTEAALQCPPDLPGSREALLEWVGAGGGPARICHNCSGKHAAMLSTCVAAGWPTDTYRDPDHPLQQAIAARIGELCGVPAGTPVVDTCGAPAFAVPLVGLATAFGRIATAESGAAAAVAAAIRAHPRMIGGTGQAVTELVGAVPGLVAKGGAECVWGAALPDGRSFAAKVADGGPRAQPPVLTAALAYWDYSGDTIDKWAATAVLGGGEPVGTITWSPELRNRLDI